MGSMRRPRLAFLCALLASSSAVSADEATDLLFFSGDLMSRRDYAGVGWLHASSGLDATGPAFATELGRQQDGAAYGQAAAGWRFVTHGVWATVIGGVEFDSAQAPALRPLVAADIWFEPSAGWMAAAQAQATPDYVSWRLAFGLKPAENWPWIGPEAGASAGEPRAGVHATGLPLAAGFEARAAFGVSWQCGQSGPYAELSVWRRF
jgi:Cellulose biosynthesis protein BcsS